MVRTAIAPQGGPAHVTVNQQLRPPDFDMPRTALGTATFTGRTSNATECTSIIPNAAPPALSHGVLCQDPMARVAREGAVAPRQATMSGHVHEAVQPAAPTTQR